MKPVHTLLSAILFMAGVSQAQGIDNNAKNKNMSTIEKNERVIRTLFEQSLNKKDLAMLKDLISDDYIGFQGAKGPKSFEAAVLPLIEAFPDLRYDIEDLFGKEDKVVVRWKLHATHKGQFNSLPPTGKQVTNDGTAIFALKDGKVTRGQLLTDRLGFLQQLGVLPQNPAQIYAEAAAAKSQTNFIDKFFVPAAAKTEFHERMHINRTFIKILPGFLKDEAYEYTDDNGNLTCVTVAHWASKEAMEKAKEAVQAEYKKQGFDMSAMLKRLNITIDRGVYATLTE